MREAVCAKCRLKTMVNLCTYEGKFIGEFCEICIDEILHDFPGRGERRNASSGPNHNNPGFDNVIRALEEDR